MQVSNIVRAWKDEAYRQSLPVQEQATLPTNPAGAIELTEAELEAIFRVYGGSDSGHVSDIDEEEENEVQMQQMVTYQPIIATVVIVMSAAPQCNNVASPVSGSGLLGPI